VCDEVDSRAKILARARDHGSEEMMPKRKTLTVRMRIRIYAGDRMLGPGKMELLSHIDETGSLSAAAKQMGMSYMRAWTLAKELNRDRSRPMVEMSRGGARGGTAKVTRFGRKILHTLSEDGTRREQGRRPLRTDAGPASKIERCDSSDIFDRIYRGLYPASWNKAFATSFRAR
jgi:N-terminal domain of molybdenum-binding protein